MRDSATVSGILIEDLLRHRAGLTAWRPFYLRTLESLKPGLDVTAREVSDTFSIMMSSRKFMNAYALPSPRFYRMVSQEGYRVPVGQNLYGRDGMGDSVFDLICRAPLKRRAIGNRYLYSDWSFILLQRAVERVLSGELDSLSHRLFYAPLGMGWTGFSPWREGAGVLEGCAPSEYDLFFRKGVVQGYVHDMTAAMMGGVAGHAGLFSRAQDLAILGTMLANGGEYGGRRYLESGTITRFTRKPSGKESGYRGLGFDRINPKRRQSSYIPACMPETSYGHIGFTGTILWIEPQSGFVFVLLSNRTYPDSQNLKINALRIRAQIMQHCYESVAGATGEPVSIGME